MQALTAEQYARVNQLAKAWRDCHLKAAKREPHFNPRLSVDALCFQPQRLPDGRQGLLGALVTPLSLSLVVVADGVAGASPLPTTLPLALPAGHFVLEREALGEHDGYWRCELLADLSDIETLQAGSRLAQQLMERVMTPAAPQGG